MSQLVRAKKLEIAESESSNLVPSTSDLESTEASFRCNFTIRSKLIHRRLDEKRRAYLLSAFWLLTKT